MVESDRDNDAWLSALRAPGEFRESAVNDLRAALLRGVLAALGTRIDSALAEDIVQDAVVRVLDRLDAFQGRSRFVSWALSIAVRIGVTELRRRRWADVSLDRFSDEEGAAQSVADGGLGPEQSSIRSEILAAMDRVMREELTERQRLVLTAELNGVPQEEIGRRLGGTRNAMYKLTHDARRKLQAGLEAAGFGADAVAAAFAD